MKPYAVNKYSYNLQGCSQRSVVTSSCFTLIYIPENLIFICEAQLANVKLPVLDLRANVSQTDRRTDEETKNA